MSIAGVQNPHCRPWCSVKACCSALSAAVALGEALDGLDRVAVGLHGQHQARAHALSVEQDVAVAAEAVLAGQVRAGQVEILAQEVGERPPGLDDALVPGAVDLDAHGVGRAVPLGAHDASSDAARAAASSSARRARTPATRRR